MNDFLSNYCNCQGCDTCDAGCDTCNSCESTAMENNDRCINNCDGCDSNICEHNCQSICESGCQSGCEIYFQGCGNSETSCTGCDSESYCSTGDSCATNACQICQGCQGAACESACQDTCESACQDTCESTCQNYYQICGVVECIDNSTQECGSECMGCDGCDSDCEINANQGCTNNCETAVTCESTCESTCQNYYQICGVVECIDNSTQECGSECMGCDGCDSDCEINANQGCTNCEGNTCLSNNCQTSCQNVCLSVCQDNLDSCDNKQDCISYQECSTCDTCDACMTLCQEGDSGCTEVIPCNDAPCNDSTCNDSTCNDSTCNDSTCNDSTCNDAPCNDCVSGQTGPPCNQEIPTPCTCQSAQVSCCSENGDSQDCDNCEYVQSGGTGGCSSIQNSQGPSICNNDQGSGEENEGGSSSGCGQSAGSGDIPVITPTSPNAEGWLQTNNQRFSPYTTWRNIQPKISNDNKDAKLINYHQGSLDSLELLPDSLELLLDGSIIFIYN